MAEGCLAGLWLLYDFLDESHTISQSLDTLEGSYWHGIMHRREPDYENAKYWFRRVPVHPIHAELAAGGAGTGPSGRPRRAGAFSCAISRAGTPFRSWTCAVWRRPADRQARLCAGRCSDWSGNCFSITAGGRRGAPPRKRMVQPAVSSPFWSLNPTSRLSGTICLYDNWAPLKMTVSRKRHFSFAPQERRCSIMISKTVLDTGCSPLCTL